MCSFKIGGSLGIQEAAATNQKNPPAEVSRVTKRKIPDAPSAFPPARKRKISPSSGLS